jgi:hypothetical protein
MKKPMKQALMALALMGVFGGAQAATVSLTGSDFPYDLGVNPTDANAYSVTHAPGSFTDVFTFSLPSGGDTISSAVSLYLPGFGNDVASYNIINGTLTLFQDTDNNGLGGADVSLSSVNWGSTNGVLAVDNVSAGSYFWAVAGDAVGANGGLYLYAANTIPEPETYAMMLLGLGLIGFMAKRRLEQPSMGSFGMA